MLLIRLCRVISPKGRRGHVSAPVITSGYATIGGEGRSDDHGIEERTPEDQ